MPQAYVSAGSNIRPVENLRLARRELESRFGDLRLSHVYRNPPVGFDGADFLNMAVGFVTDIEPATINCELEKIHNLAGRSRSGDPFGPRTLDLDLLLYGDRVDSTESVRVPRSDILEYSFVLRPLVELAPDLVHPVAGRTLADIWSNFEHSDHPMHIEAVEL